MEIIYNQIFKWEKDKQHFGYQHHEYICTQESLNKYKLIANEKLIRIPILHNVPIVMGPML